MGNSLEGEDGGGDEIGVNTVDARNQRRYRKTASDAKNGAVYSENGTV